MSADFSHFQLTNGMNVIVLPDHRTPVVVHSVWYGTGSMDEPEGKTGIAHMFEHLMFKGTEKVPPQEFSKIVAKHGGQDNAFTSRDYTAYFQKIGVKNLAPMMEIEADRMSHLKLTDTVFQPERDVVMEERRMRTDSQPTQRFFEKLIRAHYPTHPYGHPVIGWAADIQGYTVAMAKEWYKTHYGPNNATMILVGDITPEQAKPLVEKYYGPAKKVPLPPRENPIEPLRADETRLKEIDSDVKVPVFYQIYRAPSIFAGVAGAKPNLKESLALMLLAEIFGGGPTSHLYENLVKEQQIADAASADYDAVTRAESTLDIFVQPKPGITLDKIEAAVQKEIAAFIKTPVDQTELDRARIGMLADDVYGRDDPFNNVYELGNWVMAGGKAEEFDDWRDAIKTITPSDITAAAQKYFITPGRTTGWLAATEADFGS